MIQTISFAVIDLVGNHVKGGNQEDDSISKWEQVMVVSLGFVSGTIKDKDEQQIKLIPLKGDIDYPQNSLSNTKG